MSKIFFPVEIAPCADIIYGYLLASNDDCDTFNVPFKFRVRFLLPAMTSSLSSWANKNMVGGLPFDDALASNLQPLVRDFYYRVCRSSHIWWGHAIKGAQVDVNEDATIISINMSRDAPITTAQRRWVS
jgi:hypothetical protein